MKVAKVDAGANLADPASQAWSSVTSTAVALAPVPLAAQPTEYIREAWAKRAYGKTAEAKVAAATDGQKLYVRVEWQDDGAPNGEFQDAAGAIVGDGALATLGEANAPVNLWYWENGRGALNLVSKGPGVVSKADASAVGGAGALAGGKWSVVVSGPASAARGKLGVAVWNGSNEERAGLAAVSREWLTLE
ncbi:MAG: hypothetical protein AB1578_23650 [Thermodesulfobacteriota bacterium]